MSKEGSAYHVLVGLVVSCAHAELGVGVLVEKPLHDLALVRVRRTDLDVLLALWITVVSAIQERQVRGDSRQGRRWEATLAYSPTSLDTPWLQRGISNEALEEGRGNVPWKRPKTGSAFL